MANRRNTGTESVVSAGTAPARAKARVTRKHTIAAAAETSDSAVSSQATSPDAPTFDAIAHLAYSYWEARGYQGGSPEEDWLRAERELAR